MKKILILLFVMAFNYNSFSQGIATESAKQFYNKIFEYDYVEKKPIFVAGRDSLRNFYLSHFNAFDSIVTRAIIKGDTAKYLRIHFEYIIDENGVPYNAQFKYIGGTRYGSSSGDKKLKYFNDLNSYFKEATKTMIHKMPNWRPALQNNIRVKCNVEDYFQIWLGINLEK